MRGSKTSLKMLLPVRDMKREARNTLSRLLTILSSVTILRSDFFGLELGYDYFGEFAYKGNFDGKNLGKTKVHGAELAALVAVPLSSSGSDVFLKFGGLYSNVNDNVFDKTASQVSPLLGIGSRLSFEDIQLEIDNFALFHNQCEWKSNTS